MTTVILEIRTYRLEPGSVDEFLAALAGVRPILRSHGIDVVDAGVSLVPDEGDHAYLVRAFPSLEDRDRLEDDFYSSAAWRDGFRDHVLSLIESYHTVVLDVAPERVEALRRAPG